MLTVLVSGSQDLVTLDQVKTALALETDDDDAFLSTAISQASAMVSDHVDRVLMAESVRETFDLPRPASSLLPARFPIVSVSSITVDGEALLPAEYEFDGAGGFIFHMEAGERIRWPRGRTIVEYQGGFVTVPDGLRAAATEIVRTLYHGRESDPSVRSLSLGAGLDMAYTAGWGPAQALASVSSLLAPFRVPGVG